MFCPKHNWPRSHSRHCRQQARHNPSQPYHDYADPSRIKRDLRPDYKPQQYFNPYMYPPPTGYGERDVRSCKARPPRPHTYEDFMNESAKFLYNKRNKNDRPGTQDTPSEINWMANNFDVWKPTPEKEQFETNDWPPPPPPTSAYNPPQVIQKNRSLRDRITTPDDPVTEEEMNWSKPLSPSLAKWLPKDVVPHSKDSKLYEMFRKQLMCDVVILTADGTIQAHKIALCLRSSALVDIFSYYSGNDVFRLDLSDFKGEVIIAVLIYVYTGQLHLTPDIVGQVMLCAQRCQMDHLIDRCRQFMYNSLNVSTAVLFYSIAANNNDLKLREDAFNMIVDNFADVCQTTHFMLLPFDRLRPILDNGALKIRNEKDVFDAVINWVNFSPSKRIPVAHHLLSCVRLRYIPPEQLAEEAEQNDWLLTDVNCLRYCVYETMRYHVIHRKTACEVASESSHSLNYQHMEPPPEKVNYKRFPPSTNNQSNMHHPTVVHPMNYGYIPDVNYDCLQKDGIEGGCFGKRLGEPGLNPYYDGSSCDSQITHEDVLRDDLLYPYPLNQTEKRTYVYPKTFVPRNATPPCIDPMLPVRGMSASALYNEMQTEKSEKNAYIPSGTATKLFQRLQQQIHHYKQALSNRPSVSQHEVQQLAQELMHLSRELLHTHKAASSVPSVQRNLEVYPSQAHSRASRSHKLFSNEVSVVRLRPPAMKRDLTSMFEPVGRIGPKQNLMPFQPLLSTDSKRSDFEVVNEEKAFFNKISVGGLAAIKSAGHQKTQKPSPFQPQIASTQSQPCPQPKPQPKPHPKPHPKPQPKPQQSENTFIAKQEAISAQISEEVENVTSIVSNVPTQTQVVQQIWDMDSDKSLKSMEKRSPPPAPPEQKEKERMSEKQMAPNSGSAATKMEITLNQLQVKQPKKPIARVVKGCEARTSTPNLDHFDRNFSTRLFEIPEQIGDAVINKTDFLRPNLIPTSARSEKKLTFAANTAFQPRGRGSAPRTLVKVKNTNRSNCEHFNNQNNKLQNSSERFTSRCYVDRDGDRAFGCCNQNNSKCSLNTYLKHWSIEKELDKINKTTHGCKKMRVNSCPSKSSSANKTQQVHFHRSLKKCCTKSKKVFLCPTCSRHLEVHHSRSAHGNDHSNNRTKKAKLKNLHQKPDYHQMNTNQNARTSENDEEVADEKERLDALNALQRSSPCNARFEDCSHSDFEDASAFPEKCCTKSKKVFLCPICSRHLEVHHSRSAHGNDHSDNQTKKTKLKNLHQKPDYLQMNTNQNARTSEDDEEVADEKERLDALSAPRRSSPCNARFEDCSNSDFDDAKLKNLHLKSDYLQMNTNQNARTSEDEEEVAGEKERLDTLSAPQRSSPCNARFEDCSNSDFEDAITFPENDKYENSKERISERINSDQTLSSKPLDYSKSSKNVNVEASKLTAEELEENEDSEIKKRFKVSHDLLKRDKVGEVSPELRHIPGKSLVKVSEACKELLSFVEVYGRLELNGREINLEKEETTGNVALNDSHVDIDKLHSGLSKATQSEREKLSIPMSSKFCQCSCLPCHNCAHICQAKVSEHNLSRCSVNRLTNAETRVSNNAKLNKSCTNLEIVVPHAQPRNIEKDTTLSNKLGRLMGDNPGSTEFDKVNRKMGRKSDQATKIECQGSDECAEGPSSYTCNFPNLINHQRPEFPKSVLLSPPKLELNGFPVQSIYFPEEVVETVSPDTTTPLNLKPKNSRQSNQKSLNKIENILIACNHVNDNSLDGKAGNSKSSLNVRKPKKHPRSDDSYSSEVCMFIFGGVDVKYNLRTNGVEFVKGSSLVLRIDSSDRCANFRRLSQVWIRPSWSSFFRWELENLLRCECVLVDRKLHVFGGAVDRRSMELQSPPNSEESCESDVSEVQTLGVLSEHSMGMSEFQSFAHVSTLLLSNQLQEDSLIITKSHDIFDFDTEKWSTGACMPQSLIHFAVAFWDSKIFIVGGISMKDEPTNNGEYLSNFSFDDRMSNDKYAKNSGQKNFSEGKLRNRLLFYDSVSNEWSECSTTPFDNPAIGLSVAVFNDDLFVVGGMSVLELPKSPRTLLERCKILDSVYKLNLPSLDFKDTKPCNFKVDLTPGKEFQNDLTEFFTVENQCAFGRSLRSRGIWKKLKSLKMPRSFGNLVVVKEKLLLVGGLLEGAAESTVEVYDPSSDRWEFFLTLSSPRYAMRCAVMGSNMYVSGGFTSDGQRFCTKKENETDCKEPFCHCRASDLIEAINLTDDDFPKTFVLTRLPLKKIGFQSVMIDATNVLS